MNVAREFYNTLPLPKIILQQPSPLDFLDGAFLNQAQSNNGLVKFTEWVEAEMKNVELGLEMSTLH